MDNFWITDKPIQVNDCIRKVTHPKAGAISTFIGIAREFTKGKQTLFLEYDAYVPMATKQLARIGMEIKQTCPEAEIAIAHRIGRLEISEVAVAIAVSTPHRDAAFKASRYAIERIKEIVPIWKKEHWVDGTKWIGNQKETTSYENKIPTKEEMH
ncbi:molybdenum cofactor biosynthesis protein MoaE [Pseudogracilibacillus auburnensis]|uniref:Molybdopterin synthase catalytic subunit n=1 Tax=Pseudogracilibacillus auburnensis TaxID=1494959 RepID=A0A2V3WAX9_9BACI|nr:molybdenum cofactor biosynthesis protein MoaE [Pseudogracilibacillus auburnensis]MBO1003617.1 molybdenum cofactor biosynthesis protein MoaE [Pseudogracilibacillus auburnensis]PXW89305.1 molybdopterin synthase catalytic subunit [Pseudogracilibacillus auburnensis]